jgi:putative ATP-binding cassette transporter
MSRVRKPALRGRRLAAAVWRLLRIYWTSPDAIWGALLLAGAIALELATVRASVLVSDWQRGALDALETRDPGALVTAVGLFVGYFALFVIVSTYRVYVRQVLEIRWRRGLTGHYVNRWIDTSAYAMSYLHGREIDNPDQRIAEDIRDFVASALGLSLTLLAAVATLYSFGGMLWRLSSDWAIPFVSDTFQIPGLLFWVAVAFAIVSMLATHLLGRRLVPINFDRLRYEADFRYGLVRFRDHVEQIALTRGEAVERLGAAARFRHVFDVFLQLIRAERNLTLLTASMGQVNGLVPLLVAAPAYLAGLLTLGMIYQTRVAYEHVSGALSWFVNAYREIARWRANIERLAALADAMNATARDLDAGALEIAPAEAGALRLSELRLDTPDGRALVETASAQLAQGDRVAIVGGTGSGKSTLFRAIAGLWPFGAGRIERPPREQMLFVPQWPYLPIGTLRAVLSYPAAEGTFPDSRIRDVLQLLGIGHLAGRLDQVEPWDERISAVEQQLVGIARALLHEPEWVVLDDATSGLDEATERRAYQHLLARLPRSTVLAAGPRGPALELLPRRWKLVPGAAGGATLEAA